MSNSEQCRLLNKEKRSAQDALKLFQLFQRNSLDLSKIIQKKIKWLEVAFYKTLKSLGKSLKRIVYF